MSLIKIVESKCVGCGLCARICPFGGIKMVGKKAVTTEQCTDCGACLSSCKFDALHMDQQQHHDIDLQAYRDVWIVVEHHEGEIQEITRELLGVARKLADGLSCQVGAILLNNQNSSWYEVLYNYGADVVYVSDDCFGAYHDLENTAIIVQLVTQYRPEVLLFGATSQGRSLAPRVAARLNTGLTADCTDLTIDMERRLLLQTRPAFGGNLMATIVCPYHRPQMATVRPQVMPAALPDVTRTGRVVHTHLKQSFADVTRLIEVIQDVTRQSNLSGAERVVAVGRGIESKEQLALVYTLAEKLGAAVAATRPLVDSGWMDYSTQVGQTGQTIAPKLYIACGISGAIQHLAGMSGAETIVAINHDAEAPIFKVATYGIIADLKEILPALINKL